MYLYVGNTLQTEGVEFDVEFNSDDVIANQQDGVVTITAITNEYATILCTAKYNGVTHKRIFRVQKSTEA
jgi:hypothetical protein